MKADEMVILSAKTIHAYPTPRGLCPARVEVKLRFDATNDTMERFKLEQKLRAFVHDYTTPRDQFLKFSEIIE